MTGHELSHLAEMLMCPVCQEIFRDPQLLPCGHSICAACLQNLLQHSPDSALRCPHCRTEFQEPVHVQRSYALANIADDFRLMKKRSEKASERVFCDCCPESSAVAVKTCLKCEVSMCEEHVRDHQRLPVYTGHPLVGALSDLDERKCPQHRDQVLRFYCSSSNRYVCNLCALEGKRHGADADISTALRRQLTEYMSVEFKALVGLIVESTGAVNRLRADVQSIRSTATPPDLRVNGVTFILLFLWFIVLYYAYSYSVENQALAEALEKQQSQSHRSCAAVAEYLAEHPLTTRWIQETENKAKTTRITDVAKETQTLFTSAV